VRERKVLAVVVVQGHPLVAENKKPPQTEKRRFLKLEGSNEE
jgi:hypothetical protein